MTMLPKGWRETEKRSNREGSWRFQVRSPKRFRPATLRTVPLEGVEGVKLVAGKLLPDELKGHGADSMVPQAVIFSKRDWPDVREAIQWQGVHFSRTENPARRGNPAPLPPNPMRGRTGVTVLKIREQCDLYLKAIKKIHDAAQAGRKPTVRQALLADSYQERIYRLAQFMGPEGAPLSLPPPELTEPIEGRGIRENPPKSSTRVESFRVSALAAVARLATTETELQTLFVQALEMIDRGAPVPEWIRTQARGLQLEKMARLEDVKTAIERHGAALGEFSVPKSRRGNPVRHVRTLSPLTRRKMQETEKRLAAELYREFHGSRPQSFHTQNIPDLHQLVHLGRALRVDYQAARPRGPRGTPYRHEFAQGSELFTDRTGRALVILGNLKVSRAPRGRFGYIRAGAGA